MCVSLRREPFFLSRTHRTFPLFLLFLFFCRFSQKTHALSHVHVTLSEFSFFFFASFRRGMSESFFSSFSFFLVCRLLSNTQSRKEPEKNRVSKKLVAASSHVRRILRRVKPRIVGSIPGGRGWDTVFFMWYIAKKLFA